jgi:hypothetical protein
MIRLNIIVEGQTEETFVRDVLAPHLVSFDVAAVARCVETKRTPWKKYRGGLRNYQKPKNDILKWIKEDQSVDAYFSTMFDLFHLPSDFPGFKTSCEKKDLYEKIRFLEEELKKDIKHPRDRFLPYLQAHEFEALLFSDPTKFSYIYGINQNKINCLLEITRDFPNPEQINENDPPSYRILNIIDDFEKVSDGPILIAHMGLETVRRSCPHFREWVTRLETLGQDQTNIF